MGRPEEVHDGLQKVITPPALFETAENWLEIFVDIQSTGVSCVVRPD